MRNVLVVVALIGFLGCTRSDQPGGRVDFSDMRARSANAHREHQAVSRKSRAPKRKKSQIDKKQKTSPSQWSGRLGYVTGEGNGTTRHEAVVAAIQSVSAQISSKVSGTVTTQDFESDTESSGSVQRQTRAQTSFPYAELIRIGRVEKEGSLFTAFAQLDKEDAVSALKNGYMAFEKRFRREVPRIERALVESDYAILLSQKFNPNQFIRTRREYQRMLEALGSSLDGVSLSTIDDLARRVAQARGQARLYITTSGKTSQTIQKGVKGVFVEYLASLGCQMIVKAEPVSTTVEVDLHLATRDHDEFGAKWVYLGFELKAISKSDDRVGFSINGMPEFVHGGGMKQAQAEAAVVQELGSKLSGDSQLFDAIVCSEDF